MARRRVGTSRAGSSRGPGQNKKSRRRQDASDRRSRRGTPGGTGEQKSTPLAGTGCGLEPWDSSLVRPAGGRECRGGKTFSRLERPRLGTLDAPGGFSKHGEVCQPGGGRGKICRSPAEGQTPGVARPGEAF